MNNKYDYETDLNGTLKEIARAQIPASGPNDWTIVSPKDFGPCQDFDIWPVPCTDNWIFKPVSRAATQWAYKHLPEDSPRYGKNGYVIELSAIGEVVRAAKRDGLMSEEQYIEACEESNRLQYQGEDL